MLATNRTLENAWLDSSHNGHRSPWYMEKLFCARSPQSRWSLLHRNQSGKVLAVGNEAREMLGRTPGNITAIRPLQDGVIADYTTTLKMLEYILDRTCGKRRWFKLVVK